MHTRNRGYSSPIAAPGNQRRRAAQRGPTWDAQPAFLCFSLPGKGDWQFPALTTWRTFSFLVITKVPGLWTTLWPRDRWCDTAKGSGACASLGQTRHSRYTAYPPAGPRLHVSLLAARARAAQGLPPLRLELPKVTTPRNPASRVCFVCEARRGQNTSTKQGSMKRGEKWFSEKLRQNCDFSVRLILDTYLPYRELPLLSSCCKGEACLPRSHYQEKPRVQNCVMRVGCGL